MSQGAKEQLPRAAVVPALRLSLEQERLWLQLQLLDGSVSYDAPVTARLRGLLSLTALRAALALLLARHESLRTRFPCRDGVPSQLIDEYQPGRPALVDLSGLPAHDRERGLASVIARLAARPFDLERGPLFRGWVVRLAREDHVLVLTIHHLAADLWSEGLITEELLAGYLQAGGGRPLALPALPLQAADLGARQRARLTGGRLAAEREYWRGQLAGAVCVALPADHPRPLLPGMLTHVWSSQLPEGLSQALRALSRSHGATLFAVLLAGLHALLHRWAGHEDLVTISVTAGRRGRGAERVVGMLVENIILRTDASGDPSFSELVERAHTVTLEVLDHCPLPFAEIVAAADPGRDLEPSPLRQIGFSLHNVPRAAPLDAGLVIEGLPDTTPVTGISEADLWLEVFDNRSGALGVRLQMDNRLFDRGSVRLTGRRLETLLAAAAHRPASRISDLPLLCPERLATAPPKAPASAADGPLPDAAIARMARLVREVLGLRTVRGDDNFFRLGGTSMDAVRLAALIGARLGTSVSLFDLVTARTVDGMARAVEAARRCPPRT